jgi:hypothetical protein
MSGKRQKIQQQPTFGEEGGVKLHGLLVKGESLSGNDEQQVEKVCRRENCLQSIKRVKSNKGSAGTYR